MDAFETIRSGRSIRVCQDIPVDDSALERVIEAGRYAPGGGNSRTSHFQVLRSRAVPDELADIVRSELSGRGASVWTALGEGMDMLSALLTMVKACSATPGEGI